MFIKWLTLESFITLTGLAMLSKNTEMHKSSGESFCNSYHDGMWKIFLGGKSCKECQNLNLKQVVDAA